MKSSGYRGPACHAMRLSWPDISSGKPLCATLGEAGLAVELSRQRLTLRAIGVDMLFVDEQPEPNRYSWTEGSLMCTSFMGRPTCLT